MKTVYLSKSNVCDIDKVLKVRQSLEDHGLKIAMYPGGKYDPSLIHKSDFVVLIGPRMSDFYTSEYGGQTVTLGKGQLSEAGALLNTNTFICKNGYSKNVHDLTFAHPRAIVTLDSDNFQRTGFVQLDDQNYSIEDVINIITDSSSPTANDFKPVNLPDFDI